MNHKALIEAALAAREQAFAPYSHFRVGAALEAEDGTIIRGCNVESASYGLTMCAERVAVFRAVSEGHRRFTRVAVATDAKTPTPPCGACRQILWEFAPSAEVLLVSPDGDITTYSLRELLPHAFDGRMLEKS